MGATVVQSGEITLMIDQADLVCARSNCPDAIFGERV